MAATETSLTHAVVALAASMVAVPLFIRLQLGSVLGYLAAGLAIGPFGLRVFSDPEACCTSPSSAWSCSCSSSGWRCGPGSSGG